MPTSDLPMMYTLEESGNKIERESLNLSPSVLHNMQPNPVNVITEFSDM